MPHVLRCRSLQCQRQPPQPLLRRRDGTDNNDELTYYMWQYYTAADDATRALENTTVTTLNVPFLGVLGSPLVTTNPLAQDALAAFVLPQVGYDSAWCPARMHSDPASSRTRTLARAHPWRTCMCIRRRHGPVDQPHHVRGDLGVGGPVAVRSQSDAEVRQRCCQHLPPPLSLPILMPSPSTMLCLSQSHHQAALTGAVSCHPRERHIS